MSLVKGSGSEALTAQRTVCSTPVCRAACMPPGRPCRSQRSTAQSASRHTWPSAQPPGSSSRAPRHRVECKQAHSSRVLQHDVCKPAAAAVSFEAFVYSITNLSAARRHAFKQKAVKQGPGMNVYNRCWPCKNHELPKTVFTVAVCYVALPWHCIRR
jgi:hypothetical protein